MSEELAATHDDQSHYEISLTAGQAFIAFVLLLLSLAASFAFGLMIGKGQADERLVVRKEPSIITEGSMVPKKGDQGKIVELGVADDDFAAPAEKPAETTETTEPVAETATQQPAIIEEAAPATTEPVAVVETPVEKLVEKPAEKPVVAAPKVPHYAQLLSTTEKRTAEALAVKLIDSGFTSAYVQPGNNDKGAIYRVRVRFPSEAEARAAEPKLREFSKEVWITAK